MKKTHLIISLSIIVASLSWISCNKPNNGTEEGVNSTLIYGDSIIYLKPSSGDYIVSPVSSKPGVYDGFPDGIEIDDNTGAINVSKSETGLRYRIRHTAPDGTITTNFIVISGITFTDKFYRLSTNDTIAYPVYNASLSRQLPIVGSNFDEGGLANGSGCSVKTINGQINLAESIRNGLFGSSPSNDDKKEIDIVYRLNDGSNKATNKIRVKLYYYTSMATVAPDLLETLNDRENEGVFLRGADLEPAGSGRIARAAKPRPPCVIIIAN